MNKVCVNERDRQTDVLVSKQAYSARSTSMQETHGAAPVILSLSSHTGPQVLPRLCAVGYFP